MFTLAITQKEQISEAKLTKILILKKLKVFDFVFNSQSHLTDWWILIDKEIICVSF